MKEITFVLKNNFFQKLKNKSYFLFLKIYIFFILRKDFPRKQFYKKHFIVRGQNFFFFFRLNHLVRILNTYKFLVFVFFIFKFFKYLARIINPTI